MFFLSPDIAQEVGSDAVRNLLENLFVFLLACFIGFEVISKVPNTLHTPLMSGSNAISGITLVGALVVAGHTYFDLPAWLGFAAVVFATVNVVGGFMVTDRMLEMFKKKDEGKK
ncbi:NAD(P) transhydrogenase subunit alpha [Limnoraphis robusta]|uniref:proton-translocating NAD(P)(+) transhydrogenase n=1 Tax=Limnoraphis robusta CCNP1315 TaxID=3110306 RepID=A0ABU5U813_9CYAN|nr:NAD(P) transhydrogenase subunit alpha [Limnoraphis robusta]MEA5523340.1 NAD(P) transhydrogenase subunit alpha [Limnoraphis robusta CCNP1315]